MSTPAARGQATHYNEILSAYDQHYGDTESLEYRRRFFLAPLLSGLDLDYRDVADIAAGSGHSTLELLTRFPHVRPVGFDVSEEAVKAYGARTRCPARVWDMTSEWSGEPGFDVALVVGGLHHCAHAVGAALGSIAGLLRPGGELLMVEPNRDTWYEPLRQLWYRHDGYFDATAEGALSYDELVTAGRGLFEPLWVRYMGGPAYFLIYNSLVFRIPQRVKSLVAPPLMTAEELANRVPWRWAFPYFVARWRRSAS